MHLKLQVSAVLCVLDLLATPAKAIVDGERTQPRPRNESEQIIREHVIRIVEQKDQNKYRLFCSGTLLDEHTVITAAHCFDVTMQKPLDENKIYAERSEPDGTILRSQVKMTAAEFSGRMDLASLNLRTPFPLTTKLDTVNQTCDPNSHYTVIGLGANENGNEDVVPRLAEYEYLSPGGELWYRLKPLRGFNCLGDSGGPVMCPVKGRLAFAGTLNASALSGEGKLNKDFLSASCRRVRTLSVTMPSAIPKLTDDLP